MSSSPQTQFCPRRFQLARTTPPLSAFTPIKSPARCDRKYWGRTAVPGGDRVLASEATVVSLVVLTVYLVAAWFLDFHYLVFPGDGLARMANGFYVLYSGDRHRQPWALCGPHSRR